MEIADPITGAGIHNAIKAREVAGKTIIDALDEDIGLLSNYETRIRRLPGKRPRRALEKRKIWMPVQIMGYCRSNCRNCG